DDLQDPVVAQPAHLAGALGHRQEVEVVPAGGRRLEGALALAEPPPAPRVGGRVGDAVEGRLDVAAAARALPRAARPLGGGAQRGAAVGAEEADHARTPGAVARWPVV